MPTAVPRAILAFVRAELERRFSEAVRAALSVPGTREPVFPLRLPPALRESMAEAGGPEALAAYYCDRMPAMLVDQMLRGDDFARRLLWRPLDLARLPRLRAALEGLFAALGVEAPASTGARNPGELLALRPTAAALAAPTLLGSGLPLVGAWPAERELINQRQGDPDEAFDLRLSAGLVHELCHGPSRPLDGSPPPWMVLEAAALWLGSIAFPRHVFPEVPGEAVPGVSLFVLLGLCLSRLFGRRALLRTLTEGAALRDAFGGVAAEALEGAARDDWGSRRQVPFARDALAAPQWVKIADASRAGRVVRLAEAESLGFAELPWWSEAPAPEDLDLARTALLALFQANVLAPTYQTHPCDVEELRLDVRSCLVTRPARPEGVFGEPAFWIYPPPLCRRLRERGAEVVRIRGERRSPLSRTQVNGVHLALLEVALGSGPLPSTVELRWTSSA